MDTAQWCIGGSEEDAPSIGKPEEIGVSECVEFGCYDNVHIVQEGLVGAPDNEDKYYAPGVGDQEYTVEREPAPRPFRAPELRRAEPGRTG